MKALLLNIILLISTSVGAFCQVFLKQAVIVCGGNYGAPGNFVKFGSYLPNENSFNYFDSIPGNYTNKAYVKDAELYANVENKIFKFNLDNYNKIDSFTCNGIVDINSYNNLLIVACGYGASNNYVFTFDKETLEIVDTIKGISGETSSLIVVGDTAYVSVPINYSSSIGKLAIIDLSNSTLIKEIDLGTNGAGIGKLFFKDGKVYSINSTNKKISAYNTYDASVQHYSIACQNINGGAGIVNNLLYVSLGQAYVNPGIGIIDINNFSVNNNMLINGNIAKSCIDTISNRIMLTESDYFTYGNFKIYDLSGNLFNTFPIDISPEGLDLDYRTETSIKNNLTKVESNKINVYPNPFNEKICIAFDAPLFGEQYNISILNLQGKCLINNSIIFNREVLEFDCSALNSGMYFIQIENNNLIKTFKLIKK